jgi:uncharacterized repeat protein (TIGR03803 family)
VWAVFVLLSVSLAWGASYKLLYTFAGGEIPSGLIFDGAGYLYGTTYYGGAFNVGSVFELPPSAGGWTRTDLYSFTGGADGANPSPTKAWFSIPPVIYTARQLRTLEAEVRSLNSHRTAGPGR